MHLTYLHLDIMQLEQLILKLVSKKSFSVESERFIALAYFFKRKQIDVIRE